MPCRDTKQTYGFGTRIFHGIIAVLVVAQWSLGIFLGSSALAQWQKNSYILHKSLGIVIFFVAIFFVLWRWYNPRPLWPHSMPHWERLCASTVHILLYWLLVLMPLSGWVMSSAAGYPPYFFWWFHWSFPFIVKNQALAHTCVILHAFFAWSLCFLVGVHVLAALKHLLIDKDGIFQRMFGAGSAQD